MNLINSILLILEDPNSEKGYRLLAKNLRSNGRTHEADAVESLINNDNNTHNNEK